MRRDETQVGSTTHNERGEATKPNATGHRTTCSFFQLDMPSDWFRSAAVENTDEVLASFCLREQAHT